MKTVKTIWSTLIESYKMFNRPLVLPNYVTLNEKYGIPSLDNDISKSSLEYFTIGIRSPSLSDDIVHSSTDREVFIPVPFLMVPSSTGLTDGQKDTYKIRFTSVINNIEYISCYVKKVSAIDTDNIVYEAEYNKESQTFTPTEHVPSQAYTTTPVVGSCDGTGLSNFFVVSSKITVVLTVDELASIKDAANLLYGLSDIDIFEIGIYSGIGDSNNELSNASAYMFKGVNLDNYDVDGNLNVTMNVGGMTSE